MHRYNCLFSLPLAWPFYLNLPSTLLPTMTQVKPNHLQQRNKGARQDEPEETLLSLCINVSFSFRGFSAPCFPCRPGEEGAECPCGLGGGGGRCVCDEECCALLGRGCGGGCGMSVRVPYNHFSIYLHGNRPDVERGSGDSRKGGGGGGPGRSCCGSKIGAVCAVE